MCFMPLFHGCFMGCVSWGVSCPPFLKHVGWHVSWPCFMGCFMACFMGLFHGLLAAACILTTLKQICNLQWPPLFARISATACPIPKENLERAKADELQSVCSELGISRIGFAHPNPLRGVLGALLLVGYVGVAWRGHLHNACRACAAVMQLRQSRPDARIQVLVWVCVSWVFHGCFMGCFMPPPIL